MGFEGDVAGNIAALLGIDPANIRVTNIVRESRKKRWAPFAPTWDMSENIVMEMTIEPPPKTSQNSSTTASGTPAMEYGDLKQAMADLTNGFQNGSIGATLGINVTTMAMQEPIYVPQPEDLPPQCNWQDEDPTAECYLDPSDNAQDGVLWSEASQANATAKLEENLKVTELKQPKKLMVMTEPSGAFEMQPFGVQPEIYAVDQDGKYIGTVGADADPWLVTASIANGTGALINGSDSVEDATSGAFDVGGRPLSVKFTNWSTLNPEGSPFSAEVSVWDEALDVEAGAEVAPVAATCTISLDADAIAGGAALEGTTEVPVVDGKASFDDLEVTGSVVGSQLMVSCSDADNFNHVGTSGDFNVHPYPRTGNLKETHQKFTFKGNGAALNNIIKGVADIIKEAAASTA